MKDNFTNTPNRKDYSMYNESTKDPYRSKNLRCEILGWVSTINNSKLERECHICYRTTVKNEKYVNIVFFIPTSNTSKVSKYYKISKNGNGWDIYNQLKTKLPDKFEQLDMMEHSLNQRYAVTTRIFENCVSIDCIQY